MKYDEDVTSGLRSISRPTSPFSLFDQRLENRTCENEEPPTPKFKFPSLYVHRWVDYSSKYGLGFQLSNGSIGIYFNDNTKILQDGERTSIVSYFDKDLKKTTYDIADYPPEMRKKITLYLHFRKFFKSKAPKSLE